MKTTKGPPVVEPLLDRDVAIREAIESWPLHGGSVLRSSDSIEDERTLRRHALAAEVGRAADSRKCFELGIPRRASAGSWRKAFRQVEAIAQEVD